jgi:hypothetical protein
MSVSEPWAAGFGGEGLVGGLAARFQRMAVLEEAQARREEAERQARAEERHDRLIAIRMQQAWARGEPFDPTNPQTLGKTHEQITAEISAAMDREDAAAELQDLIGGGRGGLIRMPLLPRFDPEPSEPKVLTAAERAHADAEAAETRAQAMRSAINNSARTIYRRIHQEQEHARRMKRDRKQREQQQDAWEATSDDGRGQGDRRRGGGAGAWPG